MQVNESDIEARRHSSFTEEDCEDFNRAGVIRSTDERRRSVTTHTWDTMRVQLPIGETKISDAQMNAILGSYHEHLRERTAHHLGYPYNLSLASKDLAPFLKYSINNLGDPFNESNYGVHSRAFELEVLKFFASLWDFPEGKFWGYTTTCGTEGNLLGILYGRECHPDGVLYCSRDTHYSVPKASKLYRMPLELINSHESGEMNYEDLRAKLLKNGSRPAIISVNAGTTVKGAYDSLDMVNIILEEIKKPREHVYIHVDGALNGLILPFIAAGEKQITYDKGIDSISVSGHKFLGCPMPCGVVITRREHMERFASEVEYLNSTDTTIMGSRNGQASLAMWISLQKKGLSGIATEVMACMRNAKYLRDTLQNEGVRTMLNDNSTTVVFEKPSQSVVLKWQLACTGDIAHAVVMPSTTKEVLDSFVEEYLVWFRASKAERKAMGHGAGVGSHMPLLTSPTGAAAADLPPTEEPSSPISDESEPLVHPHQPLSNEVTRIH